MITAVDLHACGEPGRVIVGGVRDVPGRSMFEKMQHLARHQDGLRKRMLREPRGYPAANCNLVLPPAHPEADAGFVIMEQAEYPAMSGSNTICTAVSPRRSRAPHDRSEVALDSAGRPRAAQNEKAGRPLAAPLSATTSSIGQVFDTFSAAGPLAPCTMSNSTESPSARDLKPLPWIAL